MYSRFEKNIQQAARENTVSNLSCDEILELLPRTVELYQSMSTRKEKVSLQTFLSIKQIIKDCCSVLFKTLL